MQGVPLNISGNHFPAKKNFFDCFIMLFSGCLVINLVTVQFHFNLSCFSPTLQKARLSFCVLKRRQMLCPAFLWMKGQCKLYSAVFSSCGCAWETHGGSFTCLLSSGAFFNFDYAILLIWLKLCKVKQITCY